MKQAEMKPRIYTVVEVWRGMAIGAETFTDYRSAWDYKQAACRRHNLIEDDVQLFERRLQRPSREQHPAPTTPRRPLPAEGSASCAIASTPTRLPSAESSLRSGAGPRRRRLVRGGGCHGFEASP